jgi:hypothetical protein
MKEIKLTTRLNLPDTFDPEEDAFRILLVSEGGETIAEAEPENCYVEFEETEDTENVYSDEDVSEEI